MAAKLVLQLCHHRGTFVPTAPVDITSSFRKKEPKAEMPYKSCFPSSSVRTGSFPCKGIQDDEFSAGQVTLAKAGCHEQSKMHTHAFLFPRHHPSLV